MTSAIFVKDPMSAYRCIRNPQTTPVLADSATFLARLHLPISALDSTALTLNLQFYLCAAFEEHSALLGSSWHMVAGRPRSWYRLSRGLATCELAHACFALRPYSALFVSYRSISFVILLLSISCSGRSGSSIEPLCVPGRCLRIASMWSPATTNSSACCGTS